MQHYKATYHNIVVCKMLPSLGRLVAICWMTGAALWKKSSNQCACSGATMLHTMLHEHGNIVATSIASCNIKNCCPKIWLFSTFSQQAQSVDWVWLSSAIEVNPTPVLWIQSNSNELNPSDCARFSSETEVNRTQLNGLRLIGSGKAFPKQSHQSRFFLCFFTIYSLTETPFMNCSRQLREQNRTEQSYHYHFLFQVIEAFTGPREATSSPWRWPNYLYLFAIRNARPFSPNFFQTLKTLPSLTSKRHSW